MSAFGALSPFGLLTFGSTSSSAERFYKSMRTGLEAAFDVTEGTHVEATIYARAIALAAVKATLRHGFDQRRPMLAVEMLPALERTYEISPGPGDSEDDRRRVVAARKMIQRGSAHAPLSAALRTLLGTDFLAVVSLAGTASPTDPATTGAWDAPEAPSRNFRLPNGVIPLTLPSSCTVAYEAALGDGARIEVGDRLTAQSENLALCEAVTITAVDNASVPKTATAIFAHPHDVGASLRTHAPVWQSNKRNWIVVLTSMAAAIDPTNRRRIDELMRRAVRGTSTWATVYTTGANTIGPFTVGTSPVGACPIGTVSTV